MAKTRSSKRGLKKLKIKVEIKTYNNKTRKGTYITLKARKKPEARFKIDPIINKGEPIEMYQKYYKEKYILGRDVKLRRIKTALKRRIQEKRIPKAERTQEIKSIEQMLRKLKYKRNIKQMIKTGITKQELNQATAVNINRIRDHDYKLMKGLSWSDEGAKILAKPENMKKLIKHIHHEIIFIGEDKQIIAQAETNNTSTEDLIRKLKQQSIKGTWVESGGDYKLQQALEQINAFNITIQNNGFIKNIKIRSILRN